MQDRNDIQFKKEIEEIIVEIDIPIETRKKYDKDNDIHYKEEKRVIGEKEVVKESDIDIKKEEVSEDKLKIEEKVCEEETKIHINIKQISEEENDFHIKLEVTSEDEDDIRIEKDKEIIGEEIGVIEENSIHVKIEQVSEGEDEFSIKEKNKVSEENDIHIKVGEDGTPKRKRKLNEVTQKKKLIKPKGSIKDNKPLTNSILEQLLKDKIDISFYKNVSLAYKMGMSNKKRITNSRINCFEANKVLPESNVLMQNKKALTSAVIDCNIENEIFTQGLPSASPVAPSTSLDRRDDRIMLLYVSNRKGCKNEFICNICQYKCLRKGDLDTHIRTHTGEKPYICELCDYRVSHKNSLKRHIQCIHIKQANYSCHMCQYKCVQKCNLDRHLRKHTGEKPYKCEICDYRCADGSNLNKHMKVKHV